jgi:hypothetical protein
MAGLCITPDFLPKTDLNPDFYRSILYKLDDIDTLLKLGKPLLITLNNQCKEVGGDWAGWDNAILKLCQRVPPNKLIGIEAGNELDLYWVQNGSVSPEFAAAIARRAARTAHYYGIKVGCTPVASSQWPHYLQIVVDLCGADIDFVGIHPYGQRPNGWHDEKANQWMHGELHNVINTIHSFTNLSIKMSEYGVKIGDAGNEDEVATFLQAAHNQLETENIDFAWFASEDAIGAPSERGEHAFGLVAEDGRKRPAYYMFEELHKDTDDDDEEPVPPLNYGPWLNKVGAGLLDMMREDNILPAQRTSTWLPLGVTPSDVETCYGQNGTLYYWLLTTNTGYRQRAS